LVRGRTGIDAFKLDDPPEGAWTMLPMSRRVGDLGIALLGGCIAAFGSLSSIKLGLSVRPIHDPVKDAGS